MASEVEICNYALSKVGAEPISSLAENSKRAKLCNALFTQIRNEVVISHPWNFSTRRVQLAYTVTPPEYEWRYQYQLPADCLRVFDINDNDCGCYEYVIEGRKLMTDEEGIYVKYASSSFDNNEIPPTVVHVMALKLAEALAFPMTNSDTLSNSLEEKLKGALRDARLYDAQENNKDDLYRSTWTDSRI